MVNFINIKMDFIWNQVTEILLNSDTVTQLNHGPNSWE